MLLSPLIFATDIQLKFVSQNTFDRIVLQFIKMKETLLKWCDTIVLSPKFLNNLINLSLNNLVFLKLFNRIVFVFSVNKLISSCNVFVYL
jgi:hypothetical protein